MLGYDPEGGQGKTSVKPQSNLVEGKGEVRGVGHLAGIRETGLGTPDWLPARAGRGRTRTTDRCCTIAAPLDCGNLDLRDRLLIAGFRVLG
jgi:hypothetical protein